MHSRQVQVTGPHQDQGTASLTKNQASLSKFVLNSKVNGKHLRK